jgi:hypothetical protein
LTGVVVYVPLFEVGVVLDGFEDVPLLIGVVVVVGTVVLVYVVVVEGVVVLGVVVCGLVYYVVVLVVGV